MAFSLPSIHLCKWLSAFKTIMHRSCPPKPHELTPSELQPIDRLSTERISIRNREVRVDLTSFATLCAQFLYILLFRHTATSQLQASKTVVSTSFLLTVPAQTSEHNRAHHTHTHTAPSLRFATKTLLVQSSSTKKRELIVRHFTSAPCSPRSLESTSFSSIRAA